MRILLSLLFFAFCSLVEEKNSHQLVVSQRNFISLIKYEQYQYHQPFLCKLSKGNLDMSCKCISAVNCF